MRNSKRVASKKMPKPTGWQLRETDYNDNSREKAGMDIPLDIVDIMQNGYHIYTDGCFMGYKNYTAKDRHSRERLVARKKAACKAGWGVAFSTRVRHLEMKKTLPR